MVTKDMNITEILEKHPLSITYFSQNHLGCIGCFAASFETLEQGLNAHGFDVDKFVTGLNDYLKTNA